MEAKEIAPCGINCAVCGRYRRKRNGCDGCRERAARKSFLCSMKNCRNEARANASTCAGCRKLPCRRVRDFNKRYLRITAGYVSVVENLRRIEADGMDAFLRAEEEKWTCRVCGARLLMHSYRCPACGAPYREPNEKECKKEQEE